MISISVRSPVTAAGASGRRRIGHLPKASGDGRLESAPFNVKCARQLAASETAGLW